MAATTSPLPSEQMRRRSLSPQIARSPNFSELACVLTSEAPEVVPTLQKDGTNKYQKAQRSATVFRGLAAHKLFTRFLHGGNRPRFPTSFSGLESLRSVAGG